MSETTPIADLDACRKWYRLDGPWRVEMVADAAGTWLAILDRTGDWSACVDVWSIKLHMGDPVFANIVRQCHWLNVGYAAAMAEKGGE